jgi:type III restriction enzyme
MSYATDDDGRFVPEYAEVYGVPFSFIPSEGPAPRPKDQKEVHRVKAMPDRASSEIRFPKLLGYRYDIGEDRLTATFDQSSKMTLSTRDLPTETVVDPIVGKSDVHNLNELKKHRPNEVAFYLAKKLVEIKFRDEEDKPKTWLYPQLLEITKRWLKECVTYKDDTFPQLLLLVQLSQTAVDRIYSSIVTGQVRTPTIKPIFRPYDPQGSTKSVDFDTTKSVYEAVQRSATYRTWSAIRTLGSRRWPRPLRACRRSFPTSRTRG